MRLVSLYYSVPGVVQIFANTDHLALLKEVNLPQLTKNRRF